MASLTLMFSSSAFRQFERKVTIWVFPVALSTLSSSLAADSKVSLTPLGRTNHSWPYSMTRPYSL